jgi:hypothetical protein
MLTAAAACSSRMHNDCSCVSHTALCCYLCPCSCYCCTAIIHQGTPSSAPARHVITPSAVTPASPAPKTPPSTGALNHAPQGRHILLEYYKIPRQRFASLTDTQALQDTFKVLIQQAAMTYLGHSCHVFAGTDGVTCVFLLSESHISIHTWPEHQYAGGQAAAA